MRVTLFFQGQFSRRISPWQTRLMLLLGEMLTRQVLRKVPEVELRHLNQTRIIQILFHLPEADTPCLLHESDTR